eukprot:CAMPEP_0168615810 /NCGR_PEP_ID=MMETSP0449_2-20121227/4697_1 /TAXON_ID=1082188 /ORGANISM="Strombidium rassoulzadegani, Strain ras09" /LENGTH=92 /DNA_ID=CAMNT_0008656563 /DNA_START=75 /DNA_END=353 /DNA_ORIENTATION=+
MVFGVALEFTSRVASKEAFSARPISYATKAIYMGMFFSWFDWWKRRTVQEILYAEDENQIFGKNLAMDNLRVGDEEESQNLVDFLASTTVRP